MGKIPKKSSAFLSTVFKANISEAIDNEPESEEDTESNPIISGRSIKRPGLFSIATSTGDVLNECDSSSSTGVSPDENEIHCDFYLFEPTYVIGEREGEREEESARVSILMLTDSWETAPDHEI